MLQSNPGRRRLTERNLDFLVDTAHPGAKDTYRLKQVLKEEEGFRLTHYVRVANLGLFILGILLSVQ